MAQNKQQKLKVLLKNLFAIRYKLAVSVSENSILYIRLTFLNQLEFELKSINNTSQNARSEPDESLKMWAFTILHF
jgi:hypothetical protein